MESKFVIFLVFASLAQSSYVSTLKLTYGLSEEQLAVFDQITIKQKPSRGVLFEAIENIFDILQIHKTNTDGDAAKAAEALDQLKKGTESALAANRYGLAVSTNAFKKANEVLSGTIKSSLRKLDFGRCDDGENCLSPNDIASAEVIATYQVGHGAMLDAALAAHPESSSTIDEAREVIATAAEQQVGIFFEAIDIAVAPCTNATEVLAKIEGLRVTAVGAAPDYTALLIGLFRNNDTFNKKTETELASLLQQATNGAAVNSEKFFDAVQILADATCTGKISGADISAVRDCFADADVGVDDFCQGIYGSGVVMLKATNAY